MIRLVRLVLDAEPPRAHRRRLRIKIDRSEYHLVIARPPRNLFSVRADARTAAWDFEIDDIRPVCLDRQDRVTVSHSGMNRGHDPFAVPCERRVVKMVKI